MPKLLKLYALFGIVAAIAVIWSFYDKHIDVGVDANELIAAVETSDEAKLKEFALETGMTVDSLKWIGEELKEEKSHREMLKRREKTLGNWVDALHKGTFIKEDPQDADGDVAKYFDVNGDNLADFQVFFRNGAAWTWRYCDETGEPYG